MPLVVQHLARVERRLLARLQARARVMLRCTRARAPARRLSAARPLQAHCDRVTEEQGGRVAFAVRQVGGVSSARARQQRQQLWLDVRFDDPAPGHVREDLYELQPPPRPDELPPTRPHSPPDFGSSSSEHEDARLLDDT